MCSLWLMIALLAWSQARAEARPGPSAAAAATRAPPPDLQRFLPDLSYLRRSFPCTEAERACFAHGRLLHADGNCYSAREQGPCADGELFRVNKTEALLGGAEAAGGGGGVLRGTCNKDCVGPRRLLAATGECRSHQWVDTEVCRQEWGLQTTLDIFGEWVCRCVTAACEPPATTSPPPTTAPPPSPSPSPFPSPPPSASDAAPDAASDAASTAAPVASWALDLCPAPDLYRPTPVPYYDDRLALFGFWVPCTEAEHGCLKRGRVRAGGACHALRTRGPCASGEELVLDAKALHYPYNPARARFATKCAPSRCPDDGAVFLPADERCHPEEEVQRWLCAGTLPMKDEFGGWGCWRHLPGGADLKATRRDADGRCELPPSAMWY